LLLVLILEQTFGVKPFAQRLLGLLVSEEFVERAERVKVVLGVAVGQEHEQDVAEEFEAALLVFELHEITRSDVENPEAESGQKTHELDKLFLVIRTDSRQVLSRVKPIRHRRRLQRFPVHKHVFPLRFLRHLRHIFSLLFLLKAVAELADVVEHDVVLEVLLDKELGLLTFDQTKH